MTSRLSGAEIDEIAGDWLAREDAGGISDQQRAELDAWLAAEKRHLGAYLRLRAASVRLNRLGALKSGQPLAEEATGPEMVVDAPVAPRRRAASVDRRGLIAASLGALAVLGGGAGYWAYVGPQTYSTDVGEMRRVTLRDGSVVALNTNTVLKVDYSTGKRELWLKRGEGHFVVAKDRTRPFVVHAAGASVTAVGTAFTVRAEARQPVRVTVTEGVVSVSPREPDRSELVGAMQQAAVRASDRKPKVEPISLVEVDRRMAWTTGRIVLEGQTLGEAAAEFNRYNDRKLIVAPEAAPARVGGVFRTSEVENFARTAGSSLGLSLSVAENGDLVVQGVPDRG